MKVTEVIFPQQTKRSVSRIIENGNPSVSWWKMLTEFLFNKPKGLFSFVTSLELEKIKNKK